MNTVLEQSMRIASIMSKSKRMPADIKVTAEKAFKFLIGEHHGKLVAGNPTGVSQG